jgi:hypothetical protein
MTTRYRGPMRKKWNLTNLALLASHAVNSAGEGPPWPTTQLGSGSASAGPPSTPPGPAGGAPKRQLA